jgi:ABC-type polysaccharide/polyol phosphate export permease
MWHGDYRFLIKRLVIKDFTVRYRNMSLGVFWSLLNPLVTMLILTFVFGTVFRQSTPNFALFVLCGIVPFNFFAQATNIGTTSLLDNGGLVKRVPMPLEVIPVATVISACIHFGIQVLLLLGFALLSGFPVTRYWLWLPLILGLEIVLVCGLVLVTASINVYVRDTRYFVESANAVLFWLIPIAYPLNIIPSQFHSLYQYNPMAAVVLAMQHIIMQMKSPPETLLWKLPLVSVGALLFGHLFFSRLKARFFEHL